MENANVRLVRGNYELSPNKIDSSISEKIKMLKYDGKVTVIRSVIKSEISYLIQPLVLGTNILLYQICNDFVNNIDSDLFTSKSYSVVLKLLIKNEILTIATTCTAITDKDYATYLNNIDYRINELVDKVYSLL